MQMCYIPISALYLIAQCGDTGSIPPRPGTPPSESGSRLAGARAAVIIRRVLGRCAFGGRSKARDRRSAPGLTPEPFGATAGSMPIKTLAAHIWAFCAASRSTTDRTFRCVAGRPDRPWRDRRDHRRRTMSRCHRKMVPGVTISRIAARRSIGSVPASRASNARSGHVSRARAPGRSRPATASWWRSVRISASFHHASRRDKPSSDTARETIRKISFKPASRRSSHLQSGQDRPGACRTLDRALQGLCPGGTGFRHPQVPPCGARVPNAARG
jgi:hypothetical protein